MTVFRRCIRKHAAKVIDASQSGGGGKVDACTALYQSVHRFHLAVSRRGVERAVGIGAAIAEKIDQRELHMAFTRHPAGGDEPKCFVQFRERGVCVEDHFRDFDNVRGQIAMANRILGYELEKSWAGEIIRAFEVDVLMNQVWMLL